MSRFGYEAQTLYYGSGGEVASIRPLLPETLFSVCRDFHNSDVARAECDEAIVDLIWSWRGSILVDAEDARPDLFVLYVAAVNLQHQLENSSLRSRSSFSSSESIVLAEAPYARVRAFLSSEDDLSGGRSSKRRRIGGKTAEHSEPRQRAPREDDEDQSQAVLMELAKIAQVSRLDNYTLSYKLKSLPADYRGPEAPTFDWHHWYLSAEELDLVPESCRESLGGDECAEEVEELFQEVSWNAEVDQDEYPELRRVMLGLSYEEELRLRKILYSAWKNKEWLEELLQKRGMVATLTHLFNRSVDFWTTEYAFCSVSSVLDGCARSIAERTADREDFTIHLRDLAFQTVRGRTADGQQPDFLDILAELLPRVFDAPALLTEQVVSEKLEPTKTASPVELRPIDDDEFFGYLADYLKEQSDASNDLGVAAVEKELLADSERFLSLPELRLFAPLEIDSEIMLLGAVMRAVLDHGLRANWRFSDSFIYEALFNPEPAPWAVVLRRGFRLGEGAEVGDDVRTLQIFYRYGVKPASVVPAVVGLELFGRIIDGHSPTSEPKFNYEEDGIVELKSRTQLHEQFIALLHVTRPDIAEDLRTQGRSRPNAKRLAIIPTAYVVVDEDDEMDDTVLAAIKMMTSLPLGLFQEDASESLIFSDKLMASEGHERAIARGYLNTLGKLLYIRLVEGQPTEVALGDDILMDILQNSKCLSSSDSSDGEEEDELCSSVKMMLKEDERNDLLKAFGDVTCFDRIIPDFGNLKPDQLRELIRNGFDVEDEPVLDGYDD